MNILHAYSNKLCMVAILYCLTSQQLHAQTDMDGIMLKKNIFCIGAMYSHSSWSNYWEGTFKRDNENLGNVSTDMYTLMGAYGIVDKLNVMFSVPFVTTKASEGTFGGLSGVQDLSLMLKWMPYVMELKKNGKLSFFGIGRLSFPVSNYVADYLPMAIGIRSKTLGIRAMVDYQRGGFFATASGNFTLRSNIEIDRNAYYTIRMHYTNEVDMPDMTGYNFRAGYRLKNWIAEGVIENMTTLGGFDIRKNDMPFPSNEMNMTQVGAQVKHAIKLVRGLEVIGGGRYVISGRNMGQSTSYYGGIFYLLDLSGGERSAQTNNTN